MGKRYGTFIVSGDLLACGRWKAFCFLQIGPERERTMTKDKKDPPAEMNVASEHKGAAADRPRKLDKSVQAAIGARLRAYYDGVAGEADPRPFRRTHEAAREEGRGRRQGRLSRPVAPANR